MTNEEAIKRLEELKELDALGAYYTPAVDLAITALERDRWISVEERLPEEDKTVLTWGKQGVILLDWRHDNKWCCFGEVTHWMPLPEPPKEET